MFNHGNGGKWDDDPNDSRMCVKLSDSCSRSMARFRTREWRVTVSASSHDHFHKKDDSIIVGFGWIWAMLPYFFQVHTDKWSYILYIHTYSCICWLFFYCFSTNKNWGPNPVSFSAEVFGLLQQHSEGQGGGNSCDGGETLGDFTYGELSMVIKWLEQLWKRIFNK